MKYFQSSVLACVFMLMPFFASAQVDTPVTQGQYERAQVVDVRKDLAETPTGGEQKTVYEIRFLSGPLQSQTTSVQSELTTNPYALTPEAGDKIVVFMQSQDQNWDIYIESFDRRTPMLVLMGLFVLMLIILSGWQGFKTAVSMAISIGLIGYVLIPAFLHGMNPVPVAIVLTGFFTLLSTGLSTGWNKKALVTAIGTMGGAMVAFFISWIFADWAHLSGLATEDDKTFFNKNPFLDPRGLLFAGIIIASAGVVEDVAVSIVSGISEVKKHNLRATRRQLFVSGMVVGRDHMSALANTLIYAYVGSSLSSLLLYQQFGSSWLKFINFDSVVDEIVRSLAGTIGLIFTVPITALLAAWLLTSDDVQGINQHHGHTH